MHLAQLVRRSRRVTGPMLVGMVVALVSATGTAALATPLTYDVTATIFHGNIPSMTASLSGYFTLDAGAVTDFAFEVSPPSATTHTYTPADSTAAVQVSSDSFTLSFHHVVVFGSYLNLSFLGLPEAYAGGDLFGVFWVPSAPPVGPTPFYFWLLRDGEIAPRQSPAVPEPATAVLLLGGALGIALRSLHERHRNRG